MWKLTALIKGTLMWVKKYPHGLTWRHSMLLWTIALDPRLNPPHIRARHRWWKTYWRSEI